MGGLNWGRLTLPWLAGLAVLALALALRIADPALVSALRGGGFDSLQRLWPRKVDTAQPVRVVDIDDASLRNLGQWPWPRDRLAKMVERLTDLGAAAIVFDIVFPEPDRLSPRALAGALAENGITVDAALLPDNDQRFAAAMANKPVVLAFAASGQSKANATSLKAGFAYTGLDMWAAPPSLTTLTTNIPALNAVAAGLGSISLDTASEQGVARQVPLIWSDGTRFYPGLAVEALRVAQGAQTLIVNGSADTANAIESLTVGQYDVPLTEDGAFRVHYRADDQSLYVSAAALLATAPDATLRDAIEGHIVFIGTSAVGLVDARTSALGQSVPGVSIHAQVAEQILSQQFLARPQWLEGAELVAIALGSLLLTVLAGLVSPRWTLASASVLVAATLATVALAFRFGGMLLDGSFPLLAFVATALTGIAIRLLYSDREHRKIRGAFAHYVAPSILKEIENNPKALELGGETRDVTVLFMDIENFTPMSQKLPPATLVQLVNRVLDCGSQAILRHQGTIDKYIGDAVMAFWNAPVLQANHQALAAHAALDMRATMEHLNDEVAVRELLASNGLPPIAVRIGLSSGPALVGNIGSTNRFDYSVLGETVNTAARAEVACKQLGHDIVIAGPIEVTTRTMALLPAGRSALKGLASAIPLHLVMGSEDVAGQKGFTHLTKSLSELVDFMKKNKHHDHTSNELLHELTDQHPELKTYLAKLPSRLDDFG